MTTLTKDTDSCPKCNSSWDGGSIVETFIKGRDDGTQKWCKDMTDEQIEENVKSHYSSPYRWRREIGVELAYDHPKHYDGISMWECPDCGARFDRWTGKEIILD
jgi:RNA polymerase subunit RPABC4/transcription elongation factor Spt4